MVEKRLLKMEHGRTLLNFLTYYFGPIILMTFEPNYGVTDVAKLQQVTQILLCFLSLHLLLL